MSHESRQPNTVCQALTGSGRSAIAVIEVRGPVAWPAITSCVEFSSDGELLLGQVRYGLWVGPTDSDSHSLDKADVGEATRNANGTTESGESVVVSRSINDCIEVHCHGGAAAIRRILEDLQRLGVALASAQQTRPKHRIQQETLAALAQCTTQRMAAIALDQLRGALNDWGELWIQRIESASKSPPTLPLLLAELRTEAERLCGWGAIGVRMGTPFRVVLVGAPNVGKSTLMNRLVGWDRSITYDEAGTTRDILHASTVLDGLPIRLTDTAGLRSSEEAIEREGIRRSESEIRSADIVVSVTDTLATAQNKLLANLNASIAGRWLHVLNKADRLSPERQNQANQDSLLIQTVATTGQGIQQLQQRIVATIAACLPPSGSPVPVSPRQLQLVKQLAMVTSAEEAMLSLGEFADRP